MKSFILLTIIILILQIDCKSQNQKIIKSYRSFEELLIQKQENKEELKILKEFRKTYQEKDRFYIKEFPDYYQITVSHPTINNQSGGAECYRLDKKSGKSSMLWHEHPQ